jgi:MFS family permease
MTINTATAPAAFSSESQARRAAISAFFGFFVDMFDVFLPIIVLTPAYIYFQPPTISPTLAATAASLVVAATLLGRPLGSVIFGYLSDQVGRKPITMLSVAGFGTCTILMGLLPGYNSWGAASLYSLIFLRFIGGIFLGGEYTAANVLAMEAAPKEKRGLYSGIIQSGYPVAYVLIAAITYLMLELFPAAGGLDSPYVAYGWRIPFFFGGLLALGFILPFRSTVEESSLWVKVEKKQNPFKAVFADKNFIQFLQVFLVLSGFWFTTIAAAAGILPGVLIRVVHLTPKEMTVVMMIASVVLIAGYLLVGIISQTIGRRAMIILMAILSGTVGMFSYYLLLNTVQSFSMIVVLATAVVVTLTSVWGLTTCYLNERFPTRSRSSGFGMAFTLPVIIPSFFGFYQGALAKIMPQHLTVLVLVAIGVVLTLVGAIMGPETKDVDLNRVAAAPSGA